MNSVQPLSYERAENGKVDLYHCLINNRPKSLSKKQFLEAIELILPEGAPANQPSLETVNGK